MKNKCITKINTFTFEIWFNFLKVFFLFLKCFFIRIEKISSCKLLAFATSLHLAIAVYYIMCYNLYNTFYPLSIVPKVAYQ